MSRVQCPIYVGSNLVSESIIFPHLIQLGKVRLEKNIHSYLPVVCTVHRYV